jgi:hypothetical protein
MDRLPRPPSRRPGYQLMDTSPHVNDRHPAESCRLCDLMLARLVDFQSVGTPGTVSEACVWYYATGMATPRFVCNHRNRSSAMFPFLLRC